MDRHMTPDRTWTLLGSTPLSAEYACHQRFPERPRAILRRGIDHTSGQTLLFERMADVTQERDFFGRRKRDGAKPDVGEKPDDKDER